MFLLEGKTSQKREGVNMTKVIVLALACIAVFGCALNPGVRMLSKLYTTEIKEYEDLELGKWKTTSLLLFKEDGWGMLTVEERVSTSGVTYSFSVSYWGLGWRFTDTVKLKTDDNIYTLKDDNPSRRVWGYGNVEEIVRVSLSEDIVEDIKKTSVLRFQYYAKPYTLPEEGLAILKGFLSGSSAQ